MACIGGPIRPRFEGERPPSLSDTLLPVLTTLDYGPDAQDLDPFTTSTVFGANVSFRAGPLRDVGGWSPRSATVAGRPGSARRTRPSAPSRAPASSSATSLARWWST